MSFFIKKLNKSEVQLAKQFIHQWFEDDEPSSSFLPSNNYIKTNLAKDDSHVYVAIENGKVVGGLTAYEIPMFYREEAEMFLYEIGVDKDHRRKGIARSLIEALKKTCILKGIKEIFVGTSMENHAARRLYESTGGNVEVSPWYNYNLNLK